jgi:hypothetical protein
MDFGVPATNEKSRSGMRCLERVAATIGGDAQRNCNNGTHRCNYDDRARAERGVERDESSTKP